MRLIQVYNTFGGKNVTCGFTTFRALIDFWKKSVKRHKKHYDLTIYTDIYGYDLIKDELNCNIEIMEFPYIDDRYFSIGKIQLFKAQTEPFIYVDTDAMLLEDISELIEDVYVENLRGGLYGKYLRIYNLKELNELPGIPCCGLVAFKDAQHAQSYADFIIDKIKNSYIRNVDFEALWHVEEIGLANYVEDNNLSLNIFKNYIHLQGGLK
jgi:hypothetical protein